MVTKFSVTYLATENGGRLFGSWILVTKLSATDLTTKISTANLRPLYNSVTRCFATRVFASIFIWWSFRSQICLATDNSAFSDRIWWSLKVIFFCSDHSSDGKMMNHHCIYSSMSLKVLSWTQIYHSSYGLSLEWGRCQENWWKRPKHKPKLMEEGQGPP